MYRVQQTYPKWLKVNIGVIPIQINLMSPFSEMMEMDQIGLTGGLTYLEMWPPLTLHLINLNPGTHGDMDWGWAS